MDDKILKSGNIENRNLTLGKNELPLRDKVDENTLKETIEQRKSLLKENAVEGIKSQEKGKSTRVPKLDSYEYYEKNWKPEKQQISPEKKIDKPNIKTKTPKAPISPTITKGVGKKVGQLGLKFIPYIGAGITLYEGYELTKDAYEYLKESPDLQKELQELHEQFPDKFPPPPSLESDDKTSFFSNEQKENLQLAMEADKSEPINPFTQIEQEKEIAEPQIDNEIDQTETYNFQQIADADKIEVNISEEEKENLAFAMSIDEGNQFEFFAETVQEMPSIEADNQLENLEEYAYQEQEEVNQPELIVSDEWKENLMLAMEETEPEYEGFSEEFEVAEMDNDYSLDDLSFYGDDYSGSDEGGSDSGDVGGSDGGGD